MKGITTMIQKINDELFYINHELRQQRIDNVISKIDRFTKELREQNKKHKGEQ